MAAAAIGLASVFLAWAHARRAASPPPVDRVKLTTKLKVRPLAERLSGLAEEAYEGSWERTLAREALAAPLAARPATVNLALSEIDHALTKGDAWPGAAIRISLLGGGLVAFIAYLTGASLGSAMTDVGIGVGAAIACYEARRVAAKNLRRQRESIDLLIATVFGDVAGSHRSTGRSAERSVRRRR